MEKFFSSTDSVSKLKREAVLVNIFRDAKNIKENVPEDYKKVYVARHHWTPEQLSFFSEKKKRPTTKVSVETIRSMARVVDPRFSYMPEAKGATTRQYFNTPNNTIVDVQMAVEELRSSRSGRKATRAESRERQQEQEERNAFNSMTYEQFQAERNVYRDKIRSLEEASRGKDADLSEVKARLQGAQHEAKKTKKAVKATKDSAAKKLESTFDSAASTSDTTRNEIKVTDIELVARVSRFMRRTPVQQNCSLDLKLMTSYGTMYRPCFLTSMSIK